MQGLVDISLLAEDVNNPVIFTFEIIERAS